MTQLFTDVQPGQLVAADLMNRVLHQVQSLEDRVLILEAGAVGGTAVVIDSLFPSATVRIASDLHVRGRNFQYTLGSARASIAVGTDIRIVSVFRAGSTDQELIIQVPDFPNVPLLGVAATLTVQNQTTSAQAPLTILPVQTQIGGAVDVTPVDVSPATFVAGDQVDFQYRLKSRANLPATFAIDPQVAVASNQAAWQSALQVLNGDKSLNASKTISLLAGEEKPFYVRIPSIPASPASAAFTLTVGATSSGVTPGSSGPSNYTVGQPVQVPDAAIVTLSLDSAVFVPPGGGTLDRTPPKDTVHVQPGTIAIVRLLVEFTEVGVYVISVTPVMGANWSANIFDAAAGGFTPPSYDIQSADLLNTGKAARNPEFLIQPNAGASATGEVLFSFQRSGHNARTRPMLLAQP